MTDEQARAFEKLRGFAKPHRYRVVADPEGWPMMPGRYGQVEFHCDGQDCHGDPEPGPLLAVWTDRPRLVAKLRAIPGCHPWQIGDGEARFLFPLEALDQVAGVVRLRRVGRPRGRPFRPRSDDAKQGGSRPQDRTFSARQPRTRARPPLAGAPA